MSQTHRHTHQSFSSTFSIHGVSQHQSTSAPSPSRSIYCVDFLRQYNVVFCLLMEKVELRDRNSWRLRLSPIKLSRLLKVSAPHLEALSSAQSVKKLEQEGPGRWGDEGKMSSPPAGGGETNNTWTKTVEQTHVDCHSRGALYSGCLQLHTQHLFVLRQFRSNGHVGGGKCWLCGCKVRCVCLPVMDLSRYVCFKMCVRFYLSALRLHIFSQLLMGYVVSFSLTWD